MSSRSTSLRRSPRSPPNRRWAQVLNAGPKSYSASALRAEPTQRVVSLGAIRPGHRRIGVHSGFCPRPARLVPPWWAGPGRPKLRRAPRQLAEHARLERPPRHYRRPRCWSEDLARRWEQRLEDNGLRADCFEHWEVTAWNHKCKVLQGTACADGEWNAHKQFQKLPPRFLGGSLASGGQYCRTPWRRHVRQLAVASSL